MPELHLTLDPGRLDAIRAGTVVVVDRPAVFRITGSGALGCLQGLFTNDLESVGEGSLSYGAMLTPKGMILVDAWVARVPGALTLIAPAGGREATLQIFQRSLPPRIAKAEDQTGETVVAWVLGERGLAATSRSAIGGPDTAGRAAQVQTGPGPLLVAAGTEVAPFAALIAGPEAVVELAVQQLEDEGATRGREQDLQAARILAGWPALGAEIDEKTLPQEVRYDQIGGVSYTKGCYTGQETVARLHFRGHTNRELRGLAWREPGQPEGRAVLSGEKEVGTVRSTLTVGERTLGLALMRREVEPGAAVVAGGREATVLGLPFGSDALDDLKAIGPRG